MAEKTYTVKTFPCPVGETGKNCYSVVNDEAKHDEAANPLGAASSLGALGGGGKKMVYKKKYKGWGMYTGPRGGLYIRLSKGRFEAFSKFQKRVNI